MEFIVALVAIVIIAAVVAYLLGRNTARTEMLSRNAALEAENLRTKHEWNSSRESVKNLRDQLAQIQEHYRECNEEYEQFSQRHQTLEDEFTELKETLFDRYLRCASLNVEVANLHAEQSEEAAKRAEEEAAEPKHEYKDRWVSRSKQTTRDYVESAQRHLDYAAENLTKAAAIGTVPTDWQKEYYESDVGRALSYMARATEKVNAL
ncbi:hypothetical protein [Raoultella sp. R2A007]|uniref:hypothetical protein n=1 Tax=Raoultella sp. R2A007 TaxID=3416669 RepID=UPI003CEAD837